MPQKNFNSRCQAQTKRGRPCLAAATAGGLCFFHANPNKASELGRIGGRSKRLATPEPDELLPPMDNPSAVRDIVRQLIADVYAGRLHPRIAAGLAPLLNLQLRAIETTNLERMAERITEVEKRLAKGPVRQVLLATHPPKERAVENSKGLKHNESY